ncbi:MAG: sterol desaturase family protein [Cyanosarcina radialis HA8281-LM2]|nr:sterol desaturase family protein [Cyanosarcina radialis HA8281-LM2]
MPHKFIFFAYGIALAIALLEAMLIQRTGQSSFSWKESLTSLGIAIGHRISNAIFGAISIASFSLAWEHRLFTIHLDRWWAIFWLFLGIEFFYYWHHRAAHEIRWLWATHAVHHSPRHLNLSAAYRLGWTGWLSGNFLFFMPLCWLGFHPIAVAMGLALNLMYQFWIHTELIGKLGWLECLLNTPSHHRVHHAANPEYIDRNYGGVLIIFDRLFGTFTEERSDGRIIYGLTHSLRSHNPLTVVFYEWGRLFRDLIAAKTWRDRLRAIFGRPT